MLFVHKTTYLTCADNCQPVLVGLDTFARHSPTTFPGLDTFARHSPKAIFEKNVTCLDTFARVIRHFGEFGASGHCLVLHKMHFFTFLVLNFVFSFDCFFLSKQENFFSLQNLRIFEMTFYKIFSIRF